MIDTWIFFYFFLKFNFFFDKILINYALKTRSTVCKPRSRLITRVKFFYLRDTFRLALLRLENQNEFWIDSKKITTFFSLFSGRWESRKIKFSFVCVTIYSEKQVLYVYMIFHRHLKKDFFRWRPESENMLWHKIIVNTNAPVFKYLQKKLVAYRWLFFFT